MSESTPNDVDQDGADRNDDAEPLPGTRPDQSARPSGARPADTEGAGTDTEDARTDDRAIPGEHPEDNPDKEGEDRFDAG